MGNLVTASLALAGAAVFAVSTANAGSLASPANLVSGAVANAAIVQVHSRRQAHDTLHEFGYDRVVYQSRYYGDHGKPIYQFRACQGRRAFAIDVNWYGHIISQHPAGRCHDDYGYRDDDRRDRRDW